MNKEIPQSNKSESSLFKEAQQLAEEARDLLREEYGLEHLSNIEFVGLRRIATEVLNGLKTNPASSESLSGFGPRPETVVRFLSEFYGVQPKDFYSNLDLEKLEKDDYLDKLQKRKEEMREYLRRKQVEMHKL